jgi:hypothetical protein
MSWTWGLVSLLELVSLLMYMIAMSAITIINVPATMASQQDITGMPPLFNKLISLGNGQRFHS